MKIISELLSEQINKGEETAVALGAFDGLHLGHMAVINETLLREDLVPSVFTFKENPSKILSQKEEYLLTHNDKLSLLEELGIKNLYEFEFAEMKDYAPEEFFNRIIMGTMNAKLLVCGKNYRFGKFAEGDTALLQKLCDENGIELKIVDDAVVNGEKVSSTKIREYIKNGEIEKAEKMLSRPFFFTVEVSHGNQLGRTIGIPTTNQILPDGFVKPKFGVYAVIITIDGKRYKGTCNIGVKPTIKGEYAPSAETWISDFDGDVYGKVLKTEVYDFIRPEKKFSSLTELQTEIRENRILADKLLEKRI